MLRKYFEAEDIRKDLDDVNTDFNHKWILQQRRKHYVANRERELQYNRQCNEAHKKEISIRNRKK